jgi:hypothetical protein
MHSPGRSTEKPDARRDDIVEHQAKRNARVIDVKYIALMPAANIEYPHAILQLFRQGCALRLRERIFDGISAAVVAARQSQLVQREIVGQGRHPARQRRGGNISVHGL